MTDQELEAIEAREKAATPGPWWYDSGGRDNQGSIWAKNEAYPEEEIDVILDPVNADGEFIAHAREDIPTLTKEVRRLRSETACGWCQKTFDRTAADWPKDMTDHLIECPKRLDNIVLANEVREWCAKIADEFGKQEPQFEAEAATIATRIRMRKDNEP